jgi:hypothetical protein
MPPLSENHIWLVSFTILVSGEDTSIPLEFESGRLCVRPLKSDNSPILPSNLWSQELDCSTFAGNATQYISLHMKSEKSSSRFYFYVSVTEQR